MKRDLIYAHLALFTANLIYAGNYVIAKEVMPTYVEPFGMIVIRVAIASAFFWLLSAILGNHEKVERKDMKVLLLCAFFGVALNQLMFFKGLSLTNPINPAIIMTSTPILVLLVSMVYLGEKVSGQKIVGLLLGLTGASSLLLVGDDFTIGSETIVGDLLVLVNALSYGMFLVIAKPLMKKYKPITVIKWTFLLGNLFVIPVGFSEFLRVDFMHIPTSIWLAIAYVVVFTTFLAYLLNSTGLKKLSPTVVGFYIYLQPVLASLIAIVLGKDMLTPNKIAFALCIFAGVYLISGPSIFKGKSKTE